MLTNNTPSVIYSCGYQLRPISDFLSKLQEAQVSVVLDVRETPWSYRPGYSAKPLREALTEAGIEYEHARYAGNPKQLRRQASSHQHCLDLYGHHLTENPVVLEQFDEWLQARLARQQNICLLCYERHPADCHRAILLYRWQALSGHQASIVHLDPDGAPRFTAQDLAAVKALAHV